ARVRRAVRAVPERPAVDRSRRGRAGRQPPAPPGAGRPEPVGGPGRGARRLPPPRWHGPVPAQRAARVRPGDPAAPAGTLLRRDRPAVPAGAARAVDRGGLELTNADKTEREPDRLLGPRDVRRA